MWLDTLAKLAKDMTLADIAREANVSLVTIYKNIDFLRERKFIDNKNKLTMAGEKFMTETKVENVIILAAGWGSRMSPVTDTTPKPLVKVNGVPMIETTIETLKRNGFNNISIVVGRFAEKFNYLVEKYEVKLIFNDEWNKRNNIGSLEKAKHLLNNTLILEGDAPLYNGNILLTNIIDPIYYGSFYEGETPEWSMKLRGKNVVSIDKGGENQYVWKGGWYTTKLTSSLYREWFNKKYNNPKFRDADAAYILVDILKESGLDVMIRLYKINKDDMVEIDTFDELCDVDHTYRGWKNE